MEAIATIDVLLLTAPPPSFTSICGGRGLVKESMRPGFHVGGAFLRVGLAPGFTSKQRIYVSEPLRRGQLPSEVPHLDLSHVSGFLSSIKV